MILRTLFTTEVGMTWSAWSVTYLFMAGLVIAASWLATASFFGNRSFERVRVTAGAVILASVVVAPLSLLGDLFQPERAWHFYMQALPESWMWIGACLLPFFIAFNLLFGYLLVRPQRRLEGEGLWVQVGNALRFGDWEDRGWLAPVAVAASLTSLSIVVYSGFEIGSVSARPFWHTGFLLYLFLFTALSSGLGLVLVLEHAFAGAEVRAEGFVRALFLISIVCTLGIVVFWLLFGGASSETFMEMVGASRHWLVRSIELLVLLAVGVLGVLVAGRSRCAVIVSGLAMACFAYLFRWLILMDGQLVPKFGVSVAVYDVQWNADGYLGVLTALLLWMAVVVAVSEFNRLGMDGRTEE